MNSKFEMNRGAETTMGQSGVGFIVVPDDNTRKQYIEDCYRTSTVTINGGYGYGYISSVKIFSDVLQKVKFPLTQNERGTPVFWVRENFSNRPIIIGVLSEEGYTNLLKENQERIVQQFGDNIVEIFLDANSSTLNINVLGNSENPSLINIKTSSGSEDSLLNLESDGKVNLSANQINATSRKDFSIFLKTSDNEELISIIGNEEKTEFKDQFDNIITSDKDNIKIQVAKEFNINGGKEPMVLGDTLATLLEDMLKAIQKLTVMTPVGTSTVPVNIADFAAIQSKLDTIKSKISNLE